MASIRKRGNSYLIVVSMGYDYNGSRIKPQQKTVHPPEELTPKQVEKWLNEQAVLFERECRHTPQPVQQLTLAKYIDLWLENVAPGKLAKSTIRRDRQDIERILPALGITSSPNCDQNTSEISTQRCEKSSASTQKSHSPSTPLRACTLRCAVSSLMPWRVAFSRTIRRGAPTATSGAKMKRKLRMRKRHRKSYLRWRERVSNTKPTSNSSLPLVCGGANAAASNGATLIGKSVPSTSAEMPLR